MNKRLIIVGGGPGLCDRAKLFGAELTLVDLPGIFDPVLLPFAKRTIVSDYESDAGLIPMLQALHGIEPFDGVISMTELALLPAARISRALDLGGVSVEAVERTRDKVLMRGWLAEKNFPSAPAASATSSIGIAAFAERHGFPVIAKPRYGQGSQRILRFDNKAQIIAANIENEDLVVEAYLDGREFSVESFSFGRRHVVYAVTSKLTNSDDLLNPYVEIGHVVPADISEREHETIVQYVQGFLDVMEITDVCTHTELRLTSNGPVVIETHTRVGGDSIPSLVRNATGADMLDFAVQWPLGQIDDEPPMPRSLGAAAIRFFTPPAGTVQTICGVERWRGHAGVIKLHLPLKPGDKVSAPKDSFNRVGYVVCVGTDPVAAMQTCKDVVSGIFIEIVA
ncbi:ATP-grasp domain-containing protein [Paraherbaspirillum soli]|uniref:ATP-grasp domain-containing protein n=1 Tax=Paraherbaspirillum soli TaxID=631222 RepID=A0ABW0MAN8_9BURK